MSTTVSVNGTNYTVPATGEENWGGSSKVDGLLVALANHKLDKAGGTFTLTAEVDFGGTAGIKALYYKSRASSVGTSGVVRLGNAETISWRNAADSGNNVLTSNASDQLTYNGVVIGTAAALTADRALIANGSGIITSSSVTSTELGYLSGVTSPTGTGALVLAVSPTLTGTLTASAITASGTLTFSGLTATTVPYLNGSKVLVSSAVTPTELGYLSGTTSAIQTQLNLLAPKASPTFTGTVTLPSGTVTSSAWDTGTSTLTVNGVAFSAKAPLASPTFSGTVTLPSGTVTSSAWDTGTSTFTSNGVAFTAKAPLASPTFTGTVTLPSGTVTSSAWDTGTSTLTVNGVAFSAKAPLASPTFTGLVTINDGSTDAYALTMAGSSTTCVTRAKWTNSDGSIWFALAADFGTPGDEHWSVHSSSATPNTIVFHTNGQVMLNGLGTVSVPVLTFWTDRNTGIYSSGADQLALVGNGSEVFNINGTTGAVTLGPSGGTGVHFVQGASIQSITSVSTADFPYIRSVSTGSNSFCGGTSASNGAALTLYGGSHATKQDTMEWKIGGSVYGTFASAGQLQMSGGSVSAPTYSFGAALTSGMYVDSGNSRLGLAYGGVETLSLDATTVFALLDVRLNAASTSAGAGVIRNRVNDGSIAVYGGGTTASAGIVFYGDTHATKAGIMEFKDANAVTCTYTAGGAFQSSAGSVSAPTYSFGASTSTGMYYTAGPTLNFATGGAAGLVIDSNQKVTIGAASGGQFHVVHGRGFNVDYATSGITMYLNMAHSSNTASSGCAVDLSVAGGNAFDSFIAFHVTGVTDWPFGCDNSDSDKLKISNSTALGTNDYLIVTVTKSVIVGAGGLATNATDGFLYIPTCAGTPTGTPTTQGSTVPLIYDTTNHKLYIYDGGWKGGTLPGAWT